MITPTVQASSARLPVHGANFISSQFLVSSPFSDDDAGRRPDVVLAAVDAAKDPDQLDRHRLCQRHEQVDRRQLPGKELES